MSVEFNGVGGHHLEGDGLKPGGIHPDDYVKPRGKKACDTMIGMIRVVLCLMLLNGALLAGNQTPQETTNKAPQKFTSRSELVVVPVVVTDKAGQHVKGLKQQDFTVLEDGKEQTIRYFEEVQADEQRMQRAPAAEGSFTNSLEGTQTARRVTIIVIDLLNTAWGDQYYGQRALLKYLSQALDVHEPTALFVLTRTGLTVIHSFTTDPRVLMAAVRQVRGSNDKFVDQPNDISLNFNAADMAVVTAEEAAIQRMTLDLAQNVTSMQQKTAIVDTLDSMQQLARAFAGIPGRKSLVWMSGSFPLNVSDPSTMLLTPVQFSATAARENLRDVLPMYQETWRLLNDANMAIYAIDVRGLMGPVMADTTTQVVNNGAVGTSNDWAQIDSINAMKTFAQATGGEAFYDSNDLTGALRRAAEDGSSYYLVSYYLDRRQEKSGWQRLSVKVRRDNINVRTRSGFFAGDAAGDPNSARERDLGAALRSPLDYTEMPLTLTWTKIGSGADAGHRRVEYSVMLPPHAIVVDENDKNRVRLEYVAVVRTQDGKQVGPLEAHALEAHLKNDAAEAIQTQGYTYRNAMNLPPGDYTVRFVVRNGVTGEMGSVAASLKVNP